MVSFVALAVVGLVILYAVQTYRKFTVNLAAAKASGLPYLTMPVYTFNRAWMITHGLFVPLLERLPPSLKPDWIPYSVPDFVWKLKYSPFKEMGSDMFITVSPSRNTLIVADPEAITQITTRRNDFPKPVELYTGIDIFGKNVVSTEGSVWRHHRKITSPPFTEKNNRLVWTESLHQAQSMMAGWLGANDISSGIISDVSGQAMRLSLHVISRAGFGQRLLWPHEEKETKIPPGHTLTYKDALSNLLHNLLVVLLTPSWFLPISPFKIHKDTYEAFVEWGKYMREMYHGKREEIRNGTSREGMDLMGALIKGAGITAESLNDKQSTSKQLLTDDEIIGNAFVFILAGHETAANTIHFATLFLAMHPESQRHLQRDIDEILGDRPPSEWDYEEDMPKLFGGMVGAVMNEELRLVPPVIGIPKSTLPNSPQGLTVAGKHHVIPGSCYITLDTPALHSNPKYWPHTSEEDLQEFRPERWLLDHTKGNSQKDDDVYTTEEGLDFDGPDKRADTSAQLFRPVKGSYIPFSEGYRSCLGRRFAQVEIIAVLAVIFKTYSVELDISPYMSDDEFSRATQSDKEAAWHKADDRARMLMREKMITIITIMLRKEKPPMRFVRRGNERFPFIRA